MGPMVQKATLKQTKQTNKQIKKSQLSTDSGHFNCVHNIHMSKYITGVSREQLLLTLSANFIEILG